LNKEHEQKKCYLLHLFQGSCRPIVDTDLDVRNNSYSHTVHEFDQLKVKKKHNLFILIHAIGTMKKSLDSTVIEIV